MTLRYQQYNSLLVTRKLLSDLLTVERYPRTKKEMRERVRWCLKHYPHLDEQGQPYWSPDDLTDDR